MRLSGICHVTHNNTVPFWPFICPISPHNPHCFLRTSPPIFIPNSKASHYYLYCYFYRLLHPTPPRPTFMRQINIAPLGGILHSCLGRGSAEETRREVGGGGTVGWGEESGRSAGAGHRTLRRYDLPIHTVHNICRSRG